MIVYKRRKDRPKFAWLTRLLDKLPHLKSNWARYAIRLGVVVGIAFLMLIVFNTIIMPMVTRHGTEFLLPNVVGMTIAEAEPVLMEAGLSMEITSEEYHPDKPTGTILSEFPKGGTMVKADRTIKVVTSLGQKLVSVPDLRGFSIRQARLKLEESGFTLGDIEWTVADSFPEKVVVFSYPGNNTDIPYGSQVNLMVNRGPYQRTVFVPRLIGLSMLEAESRLTEKGLKVGLVTHVVNEKFLPETVLEQSEDAGTELMPGEEVDLVISSTD